jgi:3-dehydroquinate synthase
VKHVVLDLPARAAGRTDLWLGAGALDRLATLAADAERVLLVTERHVAATPWPGRAQAAIEKTGRPVTRTVLQPGEKHKTLASVEKLWTAWLAAGAGRDALVVGVGGGCLTDVAGFAAATFLRGVPWIAVPTTVLGMADASIGGKTGVNLAEGKNLAGALHHPRAVLADAETLTTLPDDVHADGWAEVVKAGVIGDAALLVDLEDHSDEVLAREAATVTRLLARSIRVKAAVVAADEREESRREILNFGHTVGHALEHASGHRLSHGRAVAIGMVIEARLGVELGRLPPGLPERIAATCAALGLPSTLPEDVPREAIEAALGSDKKRRRGEIRVALPEGLGQHSATPALVVPASRLLAVLE